MRRLRTAGRLASLVLAACAGAVFAAPGPALAKSPRAEPGGMDARVFYVRASAAPGGNGSRSAPFGSLARVERASARGDAIVVLPAPRSVQPLEGGIALKPHQQLLGAGSTRAGRGAARIANTNPARHSGDAVTLADRTTVRGIEVVTAHRGGIYGKDVSGVRILGNDVAAHNTSCTEGFHIPAFEVPTTVPGVGIPISGGLANGWAGIMVDSRRGRNRVLIRGNHVHDSDCGDGIDVRVWGSARVRALVRGNRVADLRQGEGFESLLAIGLQTRDTSRLQARLIGNRQTNLGNEEDPGIYVLGADTEGLFANLDGPSRMSVLVKRNRYTNPRGLGGFSANGMELVNMGDGARARMLIEDSTFSGTPGDVLEQLNFGVDARISLELRRVSATRSIGMGNTVLIPGNNGDCLLTGNGAAGGVLELKVRDSELRGCANNGLSFGSNVVTGSGPMKELVVDIARSDITGNRGGNLALRNFTELERVSVKVQGTNLSESRGLGSGLANVAFEDLGGTGSATIDLGDGALGSLGRNCIEGGTLAADVLGYDVTARHNWWGQPGGPGIGRTIVVDGSLDTTPALDAAPGSC